MKTAIIYGSTTGNTKSVAEEIAKKIDGAELFDVSDIKASDLEQFSNLILGTSTWGLGDLQDDWDSFLPQLSKAELNNKNVAFFGLGDSSSYPDTFVDGMGIIYETVKDKGCKVIGKVPVNDYTFDASRAVVDNEFIGLPVDEDNESNLTDSRIEKWLKSVIPFLG